MNRYRVLRYAHSDAEIRSFKVIFVGFELLSLRLSDPRGGKIGVSSPLGDLDARRRVAGAVVRGE
jgi:hypothetical protein